VNERRLKIITADERMAQDKGVKALVVGPAGVGKTTLLRTLNTKTTLFVDLEAGDLAVRDLDVDTFQPRTWEECRDLACYLGGPNPALPATSCYSQAHYDAVVESMGSADALAKYQTYFVDSITVAGRLCFRWCEQQPESLNDRGKKNLLGTYGLMGREMIAWLTHLQHTRGKNVFFVGILENLKDEFNVSSWQLQIDGSKTGKELPGIVDQIMTLQFIDFGDGQQIRALVCTQPNQWQYPSKDRAGKLDQIEEPHLGKLLAKISAKGPRHVIDHTIPQPITTTEAAE
jgi:energy-coupling factor transporter ATP-binding protein EcfA2